MATNSEPMAYTDAEIDALMPKILASKKFEEGQLIRNYPVDPEVTALEIENHEHNELFRRDFNFGDKIPVRLKPENHPTYIW
tara:strand:+ start:8290 stop:8535 length:246 start_codon:yes stop_codon:yes gene_type:complete